MGECAEPAELADFTDIADPADLIGSLLSGPAIHPVFAAALIFPVLLERANCTNAIPRIKSSRPTGQPKPI